MDDTLSPALQEKVVYLGTLLSSFPESHRAVETVMRQVLGIKRIERLTERIGLERVAERDAETDVWRNMPLVKKDCAPAGVRAPDVAALLSDGGRYQLREENPESGKHWYEYKAGTLLELESAATANDPCPELPEMFFQRERVETLTREIHQLSAAVDEEATPTPYLAGADLAASAKRPKHLEPPRIVSRDVVATTQDAHVFGRLLAARAWNLGMFAAKRKAYVGDGQNWIWSVWERHFKPFGFVPILDIIHALTYVYAAATAGRSPEEGWRIYLNWMTQVWHGEIATVIAALAARQQELGTPGAEDGSTSPRQMVSRSLTYLQNQQSRMNYPKYRCQGLPITSSHIESTIKLLNHRVKGSEKFWSRPGAEALLQLKADTLSDTRPLERFWHLRPTRVLGYRSYVKHAA